MSFTLFFCWVAIATMLSTVVLVTDSCSSTFGGRKAKRTTEPSTPATSKPVTIPSTTTTNYSFMTDTTEATDKTPNPNGIYGHISLCEGMYKTDFCLNGGTCHSHRYLDSQVYTCECDSHFHGQRCEEKSLEGSYKGGMTVRNRRSERRSRDQLSHSLNPPKQMGRKGYPIQQRHHRFTSTSAVLP